MITLTDFKFVTNEDRRIMLKIEALINGETFLSSFVEILTQGLKEVITEVNPVKSITERV